MKLIRLLKDRLLYVLSFIVLNPKVSINNIQSELRNRQKSWNLDNVIGKAGNSLSEDGIYTKLCELASKEPEILAKFRACRSYRKILEHVSYRDGLKYLKLIKPGSLAMKSLEGIHSKKEIGSPATFHFRKFGQISPTLFRYAKTHQDLIELFGEIKSFSVVEVGCGFGGQAVQLLENTGPRSYLIVDLPEVEGLIKVYLQEMNSSVNNVVSYSSGVEVFGGYDLFISNYAFSELNRELQQNYLARYVLRSARGYMIYNHINPPEYKSYTAAELSELIPDSEIFPEVPLTDKTNVLIVWGHKSK